MRKLVLIVSCFILSIVSFELAAQEWTRFRGPNGSGVSDANSIPVQWGDADYNWKVKLPGGGHSCPVVWGDKVFLLSADPDDATRFVLCYSANDGSLLWQRDFASQTHNLHQRSSYATSTPAVDGQQVYVAWSTPDEITFKAFDHEGKENWSLDLGTWVGQHGFGTSPIVYDDMVILHLSQQATNLDPGVKPGKSDMVAFDRVTGQERWRTSLNSQQVCYSVPFIHTPPDGRPELICTSTGNGVFSLDPRTGKENWSIDAFGMRTVSSPIFSGGLIFGSTGSGAYAGNYVSAVRPGVAPEIVYTLSNSSKFKAPYVPCMIAKDDKVFMLYDRGFASCIDAPTGNVHWSARTGAEFNGSPIRVGDNIYAVDESGVVWVIAADETQFTVLAKNDLGETSHSTPAVSGGELFLRTFSQLFCVGGRGDAAQP
jgi:outer membrane protein assembly factor BamB